VAITAKKHGLPIPLQLTAFELPPVEKKRKIRFEVMKEVFLKEDIIVDGMHRNLTPPRRQSEFHLATTAQLIRIQNAIKVDSMIAREIFDKMIYVTEARSNFIEAREVVQRNLDGLGYITRSDRWTNPPKSKKNLRYGGSVDPWKSEIWAWIIFCYLGNVIIEHLAKDGEKNGF
ncbi:hypothetical protein Tco_1427228, partial [Tanacetum coccineum]